MSNEGIDFKVDNRSGEARVASGLYLSTKHTVTMTMTTWEAQIIISALTGERRLTQRQEVVAQYLGAKIKKQMNEIAVKMGQRAETREKEASNLMAELESSEEWNDMLQDAARDFDTEEYFED